MSKWDKTLSKMTVKEELSMKEFHLKNGELRNFDSIEGTPYRIIEDKLTGELFKVENNNKIIESQDGRYVTAEELNNFLDDRFDEIFGTSVSDKKKYRVFLRIYPDQGSESSMIYDTDEIEVLATDKDDAIKQWVGVYGEPYYYYPTAQEIV